MVLYQIFRAVFNERKFHMHIVRIFVSSLNSFGSVAVCMVIIWQLPIQEFYQNHAAKIKVFTFRVTFKYQTSKEINKRKFSNEFFFIYLHRYTVQTQWVFLLYVDQHFNVLSCRLQPLTTIQIERPILTMLCSRHILFLQIAVFLLQKVKLKIRLWIF